ncbi:unnamed protein product [Oncorhynchus mykiss]|uniref:Uncharacterized protein n=1 Tax=Oncorhynchus mykiss TaxID=8022 RepID=A0A060XDZ0_ONCMY|nr:unnamed protein product [Oncorhynchus mykiss]
MIPRLEYVIQQESIDITPDGIKAIVTLSSGDMRRSLNVLQWTFILFFGWVCLSSWQILSTGWPRDSTRRPSWERDLGQ